METGIPDIPAQIDPRIASRIDPLDPVIVREPDGTTNCHNGRVMLNVLDGGKVFKRNAIKRVGSGNSERVCWLVAELDGVRVYVKDDTVIVTRQDLYP